MLAFLGKMCYNIKIRSIVNFVPLMTQTKYWFSVQQLGLALVLSLALFATSWPQYSHAQSTYQYQPRTLQEMIAYLQGIIATLEAQLRARQGVGADSPTLGQSVSTLSVQSLSRNSARLRGQIQNLNSTNVVVWFEYGRSGNLDYKTPSQRLNNINNYTYSYTLDDLRTDTRYSYRFVVELAGGLRYYGDIRTFTTNTTSGYDDDYDRNYDYYSLRLDKSTYNTSESIEVQIPSAVERDYSSAWVGIYRTSNSGDSDYLSWRYVSGASRVYLTAPSSEGTYYVRLFKDGGYTRIGESPTFRVR